jgi:hypothetical protein
MDFWIAISGRRDPYWEHGAFSVGTVEKHECISVKELQVDIAEFPIAGYRVAPQPSC